MKHPPDLGKRPPTAATVRKDKRNIQHFKYSDHPAFRVDPRLRDDDGERGLRRVISGARGECEAHLRDLRRARLYAEARLVERERQRRLNAARAFVATHLGKRGGA